MSSRSVPTTLIGPKGLLHDSLASLLGGFSYRVTDSHHSADDMQTRPGDEGPRTVLLTVRTMDLAVSEAARIRTICPDCKIVALMEDLAGSNFQKLMHSAIDGCVPLRVSQDILTRTLDLVMSDSVRIIVLAEDGRVSTAPATEADQSDESGGGSSREENASAAGEKRDEPGLLPSPQTSGPELLDVAEPQPPAKPVAVRNSVISVSRAEAGAERPVPPAARARRFDRSLVVPDRPIISTSDADDSAAVPSLSEREKQIIGGLVKGHPNKTIARACGITEATVKVHMKSILRKVPCSNRTQVAIWALEHGDACRAGPNSPTGTAGYVNGAAADRACYVVPCSRPVVTGADVPPLGSAHS